jgi:excisionase family DNA binding protein
MVCHYLWHGRGPTCYKVIIEPQLNSKGTEVPTDAKDLLTVPQAAEALDKSINTIRRWVQTRKLAHYRIGGEIRISRDDVAAIIAAGRRLALA